MFALRISLMERDLHEECAHDPTNTLKTAKQAPHHETTTFKARNRVSAARGMF